MTAKISTQDSAAIRSGVRHVLERKQRAFEAFSAQIALVIGGGFDANKVSSFLVKKKCAKYDGMDFKVVHGGLWDREVLIRAAEAAGAVAH